MAIFSMTPEASQNKAGKAIFPRIRVLWLGMLLLALVIGGCKTPTIQVTHTSAPAQAGQSATPSITQTPDPGGKLWLPSVSRGSIPAAAYPAPGNPATGLPEASTPTVPASPTPEPPPSPTSTTPIAVRLAVIGDYGMGNQAEQDVADQIKSWAPDYILTTGDNNYPDGEAQTIDANIGQYFQEFIHPYAGEYGPGSSQNRFFPTLGNHDWNTPNAAPYLDYFALPGNERYYEVNLDPVHVFALDSDSREPDGVGSSSVQAQWLQERLAASSSPWKLVVMHHSPYSSGQHGSVDWMRWPFQEWGATAVLAGHDHTYERLLIDGFSYFINGLGGGPRYRFTGALDGSQVRYNDDYGAMLLMADERQITFQFINRKGEIIDTYQLTR